MGGYCFFSVLCKLLNPFFHWREFSVFECHWNGEWWCPHHEFEGCSLSIRMSFKSLHKATSFLFLFFHQYNSTSSQTPVPLATIRHPYHSHWRCRCQRWKWISGREGGTIWSQWARELQHHEQTYPPPKLDDEEYMIEVKAGYIQTSRQRLALWNREWVNLNTWLKDEIKKMDEDPEYKPMGCGL